MKLLQIYKNTVKRFPLASISTVLLTATMLFILHHDRKYLFQDIITDTYAPLMLTLPTAFLLYTNFALWREHVQLSFVKKQIIHGLLLILLVGYWLSLPKVTPSNSGGFTALALVIRWLSCNSGLFFSLTASPFVPKTSEEHNLIFWHFSSELLTATFWTFGFMLILLLSSYFGLLTISQLLIRVPAKRYWEIQSIIMAFLSPSLFLAQLPKTNQLPEENSKYLRYWPKFSQYVLLPLTAVYFTILYSYAIKLFITDQLAKGYLSYLILGFLFVGLITLSLLYPLMRQHRWARYAGVGLGLVSLPPLGWLFWSLGLRIAQYGVTLPRYYALLLAGWLLVLTLYCLCIRERRLCYVPLSLCLLLIGSTYGPWGAFAVIKKSQVHRLERILDQHQLRTNGFVQKTTKQLPEKTRKEIRAVVEYLVDHDGRQELQQLFRDNIEKATVSAIVAKI